MCGSSSITRIWCIASVTGRLPGRQGDIKPRSAAFAAPCLDLSPVGARDGAADREPESGTGHGALLAAALELLEQKLRIARRESWPPVLDHDPDEALVDGSADGDLCTRRCVLGDVVEE